QRVAESRVFRRARGRKAPEALQRVQTHELVVAETDLRAPKAELEDRPEQTGHTRGACLEPREGLDAPPLVDQPRDRDADEDRRLRHGPDAATHGGPVEIGQAER